MVDWKDIAMHQICMHALACNNNEFQNQHIVENQWSPYKTCNAHLEGGQHFVGLTLKSHNNSHIHIKFSFVRLESARSATFETRTFNCTKCMFQWKKLSHNFLELCQCFLSIPTRPISIYGGLYSKCNVSALPLVKYISCPRTTFSRKRKYKPINTNGILPKKNIQQKEDI